MTHRVAPDDDEVAPYGLADQGGCHTGVHSPAQRHHAPPVLDCLPYLAHGLLVEALHLPVLLAGADVQDKVPYYQGPILGVYHFRMPLQPVDPPFSG